MTYTLKDKVICNPLINFIRVIDTGLMYLNMLVYQLTDLKAKIKSIIYNK